MKSCTIFARESFRMAKFHWKEASEEFPRTQTGGNFHGSTICSGGIFHACLYLLENNIISTYYTTTPWAAKGRASLRTVCRRPVCDRRKFGLRIFFGSGTLGKIKKCHMNHLLKIWHAAICVWLMWDADTNTYDTRQNAPGKEAVPGMCVYPSSLWSDFFCSYRLVACVLALLAKFCWMKRQI